MSYNPGTLYGNLSTSFGNQILQHIVNQADYTNVTLYIALFDNSTVPTDASAGTEISGNGYARVAVPGTNPGSGPYWGSPSGKVIASAGADIEFPVATPAGYTNPVRYIGLYDAASGGNYLGWGEVLGDAGTGVVVNVNERFTIPIGSLQLRIPTTP